MDQHSGDSIRRPEWSGGAVVVVVAGEPERAGRLAAAVQAAGARVAVFDASGQEDDAVESDVAALMALLTELFGATP